VEKMGSRDQDIYIMALITMDDRMTQEFGEFYWIITDDS
jgi:hypothetical protein